MVSLVTWHRFQTSTDDDSECVNDGCGVIVEDSAIGAYNGPCPAPPCTDPSNSGNACVIVGGPGGPSCAYCERAQGYDDVDDDDDSGDDLDDEVKAVLAELDSYDDVDIEAAFAP